uniref:TTF-type domain-containing protein n=1 Tax=Lactuca sativa TaxID=4236 RepID=A0A9R1VDS8_LACSA|nr:hypothetical protein LSAT_V11C500276980 [Lactuca sativa]
MMDINMKKQSTIDGFFKRKHQSSDQDSEKPPEIVLDEDAPTPNSHNCHSSNGLQTPNSKEDDLGERRGEEIGQGSLTLDEVSISLCHRVYHWLEYSESLDVVFCFPCFLFNKPSGMGHYGQQAFTIDGFQNWKKVGGKSCAFLHHIGTDCTSFHNVAQKSCDDLLNEAQDIRNVFERFIEEELRWCDFQGVAYRGHDEGLDSINKGNFRQMLKAIGDFNTEMEELFRTTPKYASYISPSIQKEVLNLGDAQAEEISYKISIDELETGRGLNQIGTLQRAGDTRWSSHLKSVSSLIKMFSPTCEERNIDIPDMSSPYFSRGARARNECSNHTLEHHYRVDIFFEAINCQIMELNHRFNDSSTELLRLSTTLDPKSVDEPFRSGDIIKLVDKFYPEDFNEQEKVVLKIQLQHYEIDVVQHADYKLLTSMSELFQWLIKTRRVANFHLIYRVASLILTLPVSTATTERSFSAMNLIKTRLRNKMEDEFLNDSLVLHFERELAEKISLETIIEDFKNAKDRRTFDMSLF